MLCKTVNEEENITGMGQLPERRLIISAMPTKYLAMTRQTVTLQPPLITLINHYIAVALYSNHYVCLSKDNILIKHRIARPALNCANVPNESKKKIILIGYMTILFLDKTKKLLF